MKMAFITYLNTSYSYILSIFFFIIYNKFNSQKYSFTWNK